MNKSTIAQNNSTSSEAEISVPYTLHNESWLPEVLRGDALVALANDIRKNGLRHPILVDENNVIWDGRSRYLACQMAGVEPKFTDILSKDGVDAVRSGLVGREMTVLDEVRLVARLVDELSVQDDKPKGKMTEVLSRHMKEVFGWNRRNSPRQIANMIKLKKGLPQMSDAMLEILRTAATLNEALKKIVIKPVAKKNPDRLTAAKIRAKLEGIVGKAEEPTSDEMVQMLKGVRELIETLPAPKPEKAPKAVKAKKVSKVKKSKKAA